MDDIDEIVNESLNRDGEINKQIETIKVFRSGGSIELTRNASGKYSWSIKYNSEDLRDTLNRIDEIDLKLEAKYGIGR